MTVAKKKAYRRYNEATRRFEDHVYTKSGITRAVLSHEEFAFNAKKEELRTAMRTAYKALKALN
jgi:hypothetical protein